jgi:hypothetical protein
MGAFAALETLPLERVVDASLYALKTAPLTRFPDYLAKALGFQPLRARD